MYIFQVSAIWVQGGWLVYGELAALHSDHYRQVPLYTINTSIEHACEVSMNTYSSLGQSDNEHLKLYKHVQTYIHNTVRETVQQCVYCSSLTS